MTNTDISWLLPTDTPPKSGALNDHVDTDESVDLNWLLGVSQTEVFAPSHKPRVRKKLKPRTHTCNKKPGRRRIEEKFQTIPDVLTDLLQSRGFQAQRSRAVPTGQSGLSLAECRDGLLENVPGLREAHPKLGTSTVHHLMIAPNRRNTASKHYRCIVDARVPKKQNTFLHENENDHFYTARVNYVKEAVSRIGKGAILISADNKAKVKVGKDTLATDRRHKIRRIHVFNEGPNYHQHDYPTPGYQVTPCGYLFLPPSEEPHQITDKHGRNHYTHPPTGPSFVINRSPYNRVGIDAHISDLHPMVNELVQGGTTILALLVDGGPDYNVNHLVNEMFYGRLFRDTNLDALIVLSYCPGHSSLNDIERLWGALTPPLTSVYLSDRLPGEDRAPIHQTIPDDQKEAKEHRVFNSAMDLLETVFWRDIRHDNQPITVSHIPSGENDSRYGDYQALHDVVSNGKSLAQLKRHPAIFDEYQYVISHVDRRIGMSVFVNCDKPDCDPCASRPPIRNPAGVQIVKSLPTPIPSPDATLQDEHFATYMEACDLPKAQPCTYMPSVQRKGLGRCRLGCKYVFSSETDKKNHLSKMHPGRGRGDNQRGLVGRRIR